MVVADPVQRWWAKVQVGGVDDCWPWTGGDNGHYGVFWSGERHIGAHRFGMLAVVGRPLADNEVVRHRCDNPMCCNPAHWLVGSQGENLDDMVVRGRHWNQKKSHCKHGHEFDQLEIRNGRVRRRCGTCRAGRH